MDIQSIKLPFCFNSLIYLFALNISFKAALISSRTKARYKQISGMYLFHIYTYTYTHSQICIEGENVEVMTNFLFLGSKITVDGDCRHEIRRCLLLGRKATTNLDRVLKSRDITLLTKQSRLWPSQWSRKIMRSGL